MATATLSFTAPEQLLLPPTSEGHVRFTREAYWRLVESGLFGIDPRIELVDGEILMMSPIGPFHGALVRRLTRFFVKNLPDSIECSTQLPIVVENHSEPQPDIALLRSREDDYQNEHPLPADVLLLIEVGQTTLGIDLGKKLRVYASARIPEYWVVDVAQKALIVHRDPLGAAYRDVTTFIADGSVAPVAAPDCRLDLEWLFR
jgi:Uma2 family endonuclease